MSIESATLIQVHAAVGQSMILYQHLELMLKSLLPFIRTQHQSAQGDPFSEMKELLQSKNTMGLLIERLKTSMETTNPEEFGNYLKQVVDNRNELVHAFLRMEFGRLETEQARSQAFSYLKDRYEFAVPLLQMLRELLATFGALLNDVDSSPRSVQRSITVPVPLVP